MLCPDKFRSRKVTWSPFSSAVVRARKSSRHHHTHSADCANPRRLRTTLVFNIAWQSIDPRPELGFKLQIVKASGSVASDARERMCGGWPGLDLYQVALQFQVVRRTRFHGASNSTRENKLLRHPHREGAPVIDPFARWFVDYFIYS